MYRSGSIRKLRFLKYFYILSPPTSSVRFVQVFFKSSKINYTLFMKSYRAEILHRHSSWIKIQYSTVTLDFKNPDHKYRLYKRGDIQENPNVNN